jgi:uncharacterized membrane protein (UPF0127 family)
LLLLIGRVRTEAILEGVDWTLLLFFSGLFVVMHGVEVSGLARTMIDWTGGVTETTSTGKIAGLSFIAALVSNVVSNVPAVMLLKPFIESLGGDRTLWLALAMSSTLAGNLTLIGSVANLIVAQQARKRVEIGFMEYFRVGALITVITLGIGILVLALEVRVAQGAESTAVNDQQGRMTVTIEPADRATGSRTFIIVLVCDTDDSRSKGLQGFRQLGKNEAALFVFQNPEAVTFWMGSVAYPIDIVFVGPDKRVFRLYPDRKPGSREYYPSGGKAAWVIETAAGSGIRVGDRVDFK